MRMMRCILGVAVLLAVTTAGRADDKAAAKGKGGYIHVVIFTMKKDAPAGAVDEVIADCHKMLAKISVVRSVKAGRPSKQVAEKVVKTNYDVGLLVTVDDFDGVKAYLEDPLHKEFVKKHGPHFEMTKLQVFDFVNEAK
jgi:hypothetical protein